MSSHISYPYSKRISALNDSFPSSLQKEGRQIISLPVADRQAVDTDGPAIGKFLTNNQVGSLAVQDHIDYTNNDLAIISWSSFDNAIYPVSKVPGIIWYRVDIRTIDPGDKVVWCTPDGVTIKEFAGVVDYPIWVKADTIYFTKTGIDDAYLFVWCVW